MFSTGVRFSVSDLNDFIAPEEKCILPMQGGISTKPPPGSVAAPLHGKAPAKRRKKKRIPTLDPGSSSGAGGRNTSSAHSTEKRKAKKAKDKAREEIVATVTLSDCLACSGCVTSSEEILLEKHSIGVLANASADASKYCVVSLSPQACSSLAAAHNLTMQETEEKVCWFLRSLGVQRVFSTALSTDIALTEACDEFVQRWSSSQTNEKKNSSSLPLVCSECPGFVLFAEKKYPDELIPLLSTVKSPQAISGTLIKRVLRDKMLPSERSSPNSMDEDSRLRKEISDVRRTMWHCAVMPCLDKKLESAREEHTVEAKSAGGSTGGSGTETMRGDGERVSETDCVATSQELAALLSSHAPLPFAELPSSPLDTFHSLLTSSLVSASAPLTSQSAARSSDSAGQCPASLTAIPAPSVLPFSNGYLETVARYASFHLFGIRLPRTLTFHTPRPGNTDLRELTVAGPSGSELRFAAVYGYRHIQNLVASIERGTCPYHYVEVMSCPSGCTNGGAQLAGQPLAQVNQRFVEGLALELRDRASDVREAIAAAVEERREDEA
eukprot:CAMPEP_0177745090 /NCGR_PEP_ID=MMETSP0484_2-20121128/30116_1 /TAXON_ID=354590 /ORGANISM="Rhodomonas lens, Strain RHODO" /LENGTH=553 /DNA_ID=CAMNT_0019259681 /DNA_START=152 /DNA_END=1809 /DNA_ORIENTATION=-